MRWDWPYLRLIRYYLAMMDRGEIKRLMILMPPQHGKSTQVTVHHAAYTLEAQPTMRLAITGYNQRHANRLSRQVRRIVERRMAMASDRNMVEEFETTTGGSLIARGVGAGITGNPADRIYIDDPYADRQDADSETVRANVIEWYTQSLITRLSPVDQVVFIQTRWHEDDLAGYILKSEDGPNWTVVELPALSETDEDSVYDEDGNLVYEGRKTGEALNPALWSVARLEAYEKLDSRGFQALFQQRPGAPAGTVWKREYWRYWDEMPRVFNEIIMTVDPAFKKTTRGSWVVLQIWGRLHANVYLLDQIRDHFGFVETSDAIQELSARWPQAFTKLIENKANGEGLLDFLHDQIAGLEGVDPGGSDKYARADSVTRVLRAGNVYLPNPNKPGYTWVQGFVDEAAAFPHGRADDQVDAAAYALRYFYPPIYNVDVDAIGEALAQATGT